MRGDTSEATAGATAGAAPPRTAWAITPEAMGTPGEEQYYSAMA